MEHSTRVETDILFSPRAIERQLERIYLDPHFTESQILRKFLSFVVEETMLGRANCLKEYTIALSVLEKPSSFKPKENGIVRIHAGRLRRALQQYYTEKGQDDQIVITIPKGQYVPTFANRKEPVEQDHVRQSPSIARHPAADPGRMTVAVLPFIGLDEEGAQWTSGQNLCLQLCCSLMRLEGVDVVAYQAVRTAMGVNPDYRALCVSFGLTHILTGGIQRHKDIIRVNIQVIECSCYHQLWSETVEYGISQYDVFDLQDSICACAVRGIGDIERRYAAGGKTVQMLSAI
jgi:TolB-like protein